MGKGEHPIILKVPSGVMSKEIRINNIDNACKYLDAKARGADEEASQILEACKPAEAKLQVTFVKATGLQHMNMTGDNPWCQCKVVKTGKVCNTAAIKGTLDPEWNESHDLLYTVGEPLEFTVFDKGAVGSKTEGTATITSDQLQSGGFDGELEIRTEKGDAHGKLYIKITFPD